MVALTRKTNSDKGFDWKSILSTVAPGIATALGGPLAGTAVGLIADKLLGNPEASQDDIQKFVEAGMSPEKLAELKKIEDDFQVQMKQLDINLEQINAGDRANARQREVSTGDSWTPRILAAIVVTGYFSIQWFLLEHIIPADMQSIVMRSLGVLDTAIGMVLAYYFGSSAGSARKDQTIHQSMNGKD